MPPKRKTTELLNNIISRPRTDLNEESRDIQCIVCFENLSGTKPDLFPVNLSCGHSNLCSTCAKRLVEQGCIRCPQCSHATNDFNPTLIPINITIKSMLEAHEMKAIALSSDATSLASFQALSASLNETQFPSNQLCQNPEDDEECPNNAALYCRNCDLCFCRACGEETHKPKILQSHILQPSESRTPMCPIHPLSLLNKVCLTDQVLICAECQVMDHNNDNHDVRNVEEVSDNIRNIIATRTQALDFMERVLKMNETDANQHHQDIIAIAERSMLEVDLVIDKVIQQCECHRVEFKQEIATLMKAQHDQCEETLSQVSQSQSRIATVRESIKNELPNDFDLLKSTKEIDRQLDEVEKQLREFLDNKPSLATFEVQFDESSMEETVSRLCSLQQSEVVSDNERKLTVLHEVQQLADNHTIDEQDKIGNTKLMSAARSGDDITVGTLIKFGANIQLHTKLGYTALVIAADQGHDKCLELLLEAGAQKDTQTNNGDTALTCAAFEGHDKCLELLLEAGTQKESQDEEGFTAFILAAHEGHDKCLELLLEAGAQKDTQNNGGSTALIVTAMRGHDKCLELLLEAGAHKDTQNNGGNTALILAAGKGHDKCLELLLEAGAQDNIQNNDGKTALESALDDKCRRLLRGF